MGVPEDRRNYYLVEKATATAAPLPAAYPLITPAQTPSFAPKMTFAQHQPLPVDKGLSSHHAERNGPVRLCPDSFALSLFAGLPETRKGHQH